MYLVYGKGKTGDAVAQFLESKNIKYLQTDDKDFSPDILKNVKEIIVSPGIPFFSDIYKYAKKNKISIIGEIEFAYRFSKGKIIAITGTDGKTTTTKLIYEILKNAGKNVYIGGNYGIPFISFAEKTTENSYTVLELSSFQLYSIRNFRPDIAVVLNIDVDHLNWHKKLRHYICSKLKITKNQTKNDFLLLNKNLKNTKIKTKAKKLFVSFEDFKNIPVKKTNLVGIHNQENIAFSYTVSRLLNIDERIIIKSIENFEPVEHRLEFVKEINGIKIYNDAKSTTVQATEKALQSFEKNIILIMGGINKGGDFSKIKNLIHKKVKKLILIGKDKNSINSQINFKNTYMANSLEDAVKNALNTAIPGDTLIFSPACASFDMFKNYEDRGVQFKTLIKNVKI